MVEMLVECDYLAKKQDELTIKKGDIVKDVIKKSPGWFEGNLNDKRGLFPDHCVSLRDKDSSVILRNKKDCGRQCRVIFSYSQDHEDELNLKVGEVIDVLGEEEEGWWRGTLNGKEGVFPSNFVQEISPVKTKKPGSREDLNSFIEAESRTPSLPPKPVKTICEVKYAYKAQNEDELSLKEGDLITLISKDGTDPGWWKGELSGRVGVFPDNFVAVLPSDDKPREDVTLRVKPTQSPDVAKTVSQRSSIESKANDNDVTKNPPVPAKKPAVPIKKSPSSGAGSIFQGLRKKLEGIDKKDVVDGGVGSKSKYDVNKSKKKEDENQNAFDQVERNSLLKDVRAGRAKPPVRRPPSNTNKEDTADIFDSSSESEAVINVKQESQEIVEIKPQVREWEKRKAPWLEEMKLNQAKRSSTSPGPENKKSIYAELEDVKNVPEKESPVDMSKSMPALGLKRLKSPLEPDNFPAKPTKPILKPTNMNIANDVHSHSNSNSFSSNVPNTNNLNFNINEHQHIDKKSDTKSNEFSNNISSNNASETITYKQYVDLVHKVEILERLVEKQSQIIAQQNHIHQTAIEELRVKLLAEIDKRLVLESEFEKVAHCMNI